MCVGASACSLVTPAFAQGDLATAHTDIRAAVTDAYEDNVLRLPKSTPTPFSYTRNDYRFTPALNIDVVRPIGLQSVFLSGNVGYDFYARNKQLERERINLDGGADLRFGGTCRQHVQLGYSRQQSDLRDVFSTVRLQNREQRKSIGLAASCSGLIGIKPGVTYDYTNVSNSDDSREQGNYHASTFGGTLGYVSPALGEVSLYASYRFGTYPNRSRIPGIRVREDINVYNVGLRYSRSLGTRLRGNVSIGYTKVKPKLPGTAPFNGASYSADITFVPTTQLQTVVGISRSVNQSNLLQNSYSVDDSYSFAATYAVSPFIRANAGASFSKRKFKDSPLLGPTPFGSGDRTRQLSTGLGYTPPGKFSYAFDVAATKRSSALRRFDYNYFVARLTVRFRLGV